MPNLDLVWLEPNGYFDKSFVELLAEQTKLPQKKAQISAGI